MTLSPFAEAEVSLFDGDFDRALASILRTKCDFASGGPGNTGEIGDIFRIPSKLWLAQRGRRLDRHVPGGLLAPHNKKSAGQKKERDKLPLSFFLLGW